MRIDIDKVDNLEIEGVDSNDYPDFTDTFFSSGTYKGRELTDIELDRLSDDYPEVLNTMAFEHFM